ncbi:MAG: MurT ligase domain-containing protein [Chloroflexia bacterium]
MRALHALALLLGRAAGSLSRRLGRGGGTTLPGLLAQRIDRSFIPALCSRLERGTLLITGTNGKTTTARMLAHILRAAGWRPIHNRAGANLVEGIASTLVYASDFSGRPRGDSGLFEVDEAHLPQAVALCRPRLVLLHNLFRDQLDRYGEVDYVAARWGEALRALPASATVLLNADDPAIAALGEGLEARVTYYGLDLPALGRAVPDHMADARYCRRCGAPYAYAPAYFGHIGRYRCPNCGHMRPAPEVRLTALEIAGTTRPRARLNVPEGERELLLPLPGLYNAYNALAAIAAARALGVALDDAIAALSGFRAAFGRMEWVQAEGRQILVALIKNPVGASQVVHMLAEAEEPHGYLIVINDRIADGTDVSWLWDADWEALAGRVAFAVVSGTRAADMGVRLKYAGIEERLIVIEPDLEQALDRALERTSEGGTLYLLPTYTAMLEVRALMARRGYVAPFWED